MVVCIPFPRQFSFWFGDARHGYEGEWIREERIREEEEEEKPHLSFGVPTTYYSGLCRILLL